MGTSSCGDPRRVRARAAAATSGWRVGAGSCDDRRVRPHAIAAYLIVACVACHHHGPTVSGAALYAQVTALQADKKAPVLASSGTLEVRTDQFLIAGEQLFVVGQVVDKCKGGDPTADPDCTLALLIDKKFELRDKAPTVKGEPGGSDLSLKTKALLVLTAMGAGMTYGAFKCELFDGCKGLLGIGAGLDAIVILVILVGGKD